MKIFSGSSNKPLAGKIAHRLQTSLSPLEIHVFPDGEKRIQVQEKVLGQDCIVVQATSPPVDENYMELFLIVDGLKRSGAKSVTVVMPYVGYQRQDHVFRDGEAVSLDVVVKTLEANGVDRFIAFDFHSIKIPELFKVPVVHLSALSLFAKKIKETLLGPHSLLVSPDMGGVRRIKILSEMLSDMLYVAVVKNRDLETGAVSSDKIEGELNGAKRALIVDDMISSGKTIDAACLLLKKQGVEEMCVFATHAIFSERAPEILQNSLALKIYVTDTVYIPKEKQFAKLEILSVAEMIASALKASSI